MADKYKSFEHLASEKKEGEHYKICKSSHRSKVCIISPHGGGVEPGVSELVTATAGNQFSFYLFEGIQAGNNGELHITSHHFDEPVGREFVSQHAFALAIHGYGEGYALTYLGGGNREAGGTIARYLRSAGFAVPSHSVTPPDVRGFEPDNICNCCAGASGGVQLEITEGQRAAFFDGDLNKRAGRKLTTRVFSDYVTALQHALIEVGGSFDHD